MRKFISILFALVLVASFSLIPALPAAAQEVPNPTFATVNMATGTTPSKQISIKWERAPNIPGAGFSAPDAIHVKTSAATVDFAMVIVPTNFTLTDNTTISYWGYTAGGDVKALDEIYLFLDTDEILLSHKTGPQTSERWGKWDQWTLKGDYVEFRNEWHTYPYVEANLTDYTGGDYNVLAIALTAGPTTPGVPVNIDVYFDQLTVDGVPLLDNDTGFIDVPLPLLRFPAPCIQDAVNAALPGTTISVAAGTYVGSVYVWKPLTIRSTAGPETTILDASGAGWGSNGFTVIASDVTIEGFTVYGPNVFNSAPFMIGGLFPGDLRHLGVEHVTVRGNIIQAKDVGHPTWTAVYIYKSSHNLIENNKIEGTVWRAIQIYDGSVDHEIAYISGESKVPGSYDGWCQFPHPCSRVLTDHKYYQTWNGIQLTPANGELVCPSQGNRIVGNEIANSEFGGIFVGAWPPSGGLWTDNTGTEFTGNYIHGDSDMAMGTAFSSGSKAFSENIIESCEVGLQVFGDGVSDTSVSANNFRNNNIQVLDAAEALVIEDVLTNNLFDRAVTVDHPGGSLLHTIWSKIQAAINAASDKDTINVAAGTYGEVVTIDKRLTLNGAKAGEDARTRDTSSGESILDGTGLKLGVGVGAFNFEDGVSKVIIDGFEVCNYPGSRNPGDGSAVMACTYNGVHGLSKITIQNNYLHDLGWNGILVWSNNEVIQKDFTIQFNLIEEAPYAGIELTNVKNAQVLNNKIIAPTVLVNDPGDAGVGIEIAARAYPTFDITASDVLVEGNQIIGAFPTGSRAGVNLLSRTYSSSSNATLTKVTVNGNTVSGGTNVRAGILVVAESRDGGPATINKLEIENNTLDGNTDGIQIQDFVKSGSGTASHSKISITGNQIINSTATSSGVHLLSGTSADGISVNFNNIVDNALLGINNEGTETLDATNNWWGTKVKGEIETMVSANVDFDPWIEAGVTGSTSGTTVGDGDTVDATKTTGTKVLKKGSGTPTITVTKYTGNPGGGAPGGFTSAGNKYIDVHIDDTTGVDEIEIRSYYTLADIAGLNEATLKLSWWDGTAWVQCSPSGATYPIVDPIYRGYIWAIIRAAGAIPGSIPTLDDLKGAPFMSMGMPPAAPAGGGGGGAPPPPPPGITSLSGFVGGGGRFYFSVIASSEDDVCTLTIDSGTIGLTKDGKPLREISIMVTDEPPTPPEGAYIIGLAYDFSPDGATFEPPASLTFTYDPSLIPKGIDEENLVIALWDADAGNWVVLDDCIVDPVANTITAPISHFTTFAVLGFEPAVFKCSALTIAPDEVAIGESVNISVLVSNTGATSSGYELILKIDGVAEATKQIVLDAGASREVSFTISKDASGVYQVNIDGLGGSFVVKGKPTPAPAPPPTPPAPQAKPAVNWPVLGGIIAAVVLVGLLIFFLVRRRAY